VTSQWGADPPAEPGMLMPAEAARRLGVHRRTLAQWERDGILPALKTAGGHRRYREADVQALLETSQEKHGN
jgi:excisionase family DNA binding protein